MARQKQFASAAERQAAWRAARNVTPNVTNEAANVTPVVTIEAANVTIDQPGVTIDRQNVTPPGFVAFKDCPDVPRDCRADPWIGAGRGTVRTYKGRRFVLVARGDTDPSHPEHGVVTAADWHARQHQHCAHGLAGWSCHAC